LKRAEHDADPLDQALLGQHVIIAQRDPKISGFIYIEQQVIAV
jgi:hypothetical protein